MAFGYRRDDLCVKVQRFGLNRLERIAAIVQQCRLQCPNSPPQRGRNEISNDHTRGCSPLRARSGSRVDPDRSRVFIVNAGHPPPLIITRQRRPAPISHHFALGVFPAAAAAGAAGRNRSSPCQQALGCCWTPTAPTEVSARTAPDWGPTFHGPGCVCVGVVGEGVQRQGGVAEWVEQDGSFGDRVGGVFVPVAVDEVSERVHVAWSVPVRKSLSRSNRSAVASNTAAGAASPQGYLGHRRGRLTLTTVPPPGASPSSIVPRWRSTIRRQVDRPMP